jgi:hypothetical protein
MTTELTPSIAAVTLDGHEAGATHSSEPLEAFVDDDAGGDEEEAEENNDDLDGGLAALSDSPLLLGLLSGEAAAFFHREVLDQRLRPTDRAMFVRAGRDFRNAVVDSGLLRAGRDGVKGFSKKLEVQNFVASIELLEWARANGMEWNEQVCCHVAGGGHLKALQWLRDGELHQPPWPWDWHTCAAAAKGGYLELLQWCRQHGCDWNHSVCQSAAVGGHLYVNQWARLNGCEWNADTMDAAAGHRDPAMVASARPPVPVECVHHCARCDGRSFGDVALASKQRMSLGLKHCPRRTWLRIPPCCTVGDRQRMRRWP